MAQPGDVITIHQGVYRERIAPPRGGRSDRKRIVYQAARGEKVEIKGSEVVKGWVKVQVKAASLNHHDVWSLRGVGLPAERMPMILGTDAVGATSAAEHANAITYDYPMFSKPTTVADFVATLQGGEASGADTSRGY